MRVSTGMYFDSGVRGISQQMSAVYKLQQQIATGRRIVTPADDPVGAAQALQTQQAKDVNSQYATNIGNAKSALGLEESQLESTSGILTRVKELAIQAGNATLSALDRKSVAMELRARFDELLGIANAQDGTGQYLFAGYSGDSKPFSGSVETTVSYAGDAGQRQLQVSASRLLEVSDSGEAVFQRIVNGNGTFSTTYGSNTVTPGANLGTGVIDSGTVTNPSAWVAPTLPALPSEAHYSISFSVSAGVTTYQIWNGDPGTGTALLATPGTYVSGQSIALQQTTPSAVDFGSSLVVTGAPADGDSFQVSSSNNQSMFDSLRNLINTVEGSKATAAESARYQIDLNNAMSDLDRASDNILQVRAAIGSRLNEADSLENINGDVGLQYDERLSNLQDLDVVKAYTDLTRKITEMQAAQKSFEATASLSLFNYL